jgi:hypothetical protein
VGLVARLTAGTNLVLALTARGPTLGHWVRYSSAEALQQSFIFSSRCVRVTVGTDATRDGSPGPGDRELCIYICRYPPFIY